MTPEQSKAARAIAGMTQEDLAAASQVAKATIANFEVGKRKPYPRTLAALRQALEERGVLFTEDGVAKRNV